MTDAEELELLQLQKQKSLSLAAPAEGPNPFFEPSAPRQTGQPDPGWRGGAQAYLGKYMDMVPFGKTASALLANRALRVARDFGLGETGVHLTDRAKAELQAKGMPDLSGNTIPEDPEESYRQVRDEGNARIEEAARQHPVWGGLGSVSGFGASLALPVPKVFSGANYLSRAGNALTSGVTLGAAMSADRSSADVTKGEYGQLARDALGWDALKRAGSEISDGHWLTGGLHALGSGALGGAGGGLALQQAFELARPVGKGARFLSDTAKRLREGGYINTTPEAQLLIDQGVPLTLGERDPSSTFGRIEEVTANKPEYQQLKKLREAAQDSGRNVVLRNAGAPGAPAPNPAASALEQIEQLKHGYTGQYEAALNGERLSPDLYQGDGKWRGFLTDPTLQGSAKLRGAFELATENPKLYASPQDRAEVMDFLTRQYQSLTKAGQAGGDVDAVALQKMRTEIQNAEQAWRRVEGPAAASKADMLGTAADHITNLMDTQLPPSKVDLLRGADSTYRNVLAAGDAANTRTAWANNGNFTTKEMLGAIQKRGSTPELENLARANHEIFTANYPLNGIQAPIMEHVPGYKYVAPAWAYAANTIPSIRAHALGTGELPGFLGKTLGAVDNAGAFIESLTGDPGRDALIRALARREQGQMSPVAGAFAQQDQQP